ncbi:MAG: rubrerythrin family protein [Methanomicrobiales archaeon]|nr:rubrerythrin family protein [Methanomicrobiales archaeon]
MTTRENVMAAFAGESQANRKYAAFSEKAQEEGFRNVALLFKAASEAEAIHAKRLLQASGGIAATQENLVKSIGGETHEYEVMYPAFLTEALKEGDRVAELVFTHAMKAEAVHARLYKKALEVLRTGKDIDGKIYLCPVCGNIEIGTVPKTCPICNVPGNLFRLIE